MEQKKYIIAGLNTQIDAHEGWTIETQARAYLCDFDGEPDIITGVSDDFIAQQHKQYPQLSLADCEYMWTGEQFCTALLEFDGFMLHSSAVVYEGRAYLFSAPSGTGKSTHTALWCEVFGDTAYILNDDKPVLRIENGEVVAYGTPWSGKTDLNRNVGVPLQGICFIERSEENRIKRVSTAEAVYMLLNQTIRPAAPEQMERLLLVLDKVLSKAQVYKMGCNISRDAVEMAYEAMR